MPRTGRGGTRQGTPGKAYGNRTDLNLPISTVPGQPYGEATDQANAQRALPMAQSPVSVSPPSGQSQGPRTAAPGSLPFLEPTNQPGLPITHGLPFGPGAGPEIMGQAATVPQRPVSTTFDELASSPNATPAVSGLADVARLLGL